MTSARGCRVGEGATCSSNMEPCALRPVAERGWTEEKERVLIAFFSKHNCLWNYKSESYKNRQLRWETLEQLRTLLSAHPPPAPLTVEDIKSKFKNLRTTFQRQYKMVQVSKACNAEELVPQWKHYQQLLFLQGCLDQEDGSDNTLVSPPTIPEEVSQPRLTVSLVPGLTAATNTSPLSNTMVKYYWTEEQERALISFYSEHSCLWNKKSENHNNRQLRLKLLETLRNLLSSHTLSITVEEIKCKFKNLRTVFKREYKAVQASRASEKPYMSRWKHFQQLLFLSESCEEDDFPDEPHALLPHENTAVDQADCTSSSAFRQTDVQSDSGPAHQLFLSSVNLTATDTLPMSPSTSLQDPTLDFSAPCWGQPDSRVSVDSRLLWSEAKVQLLIAFFSEHSCLWNHRSENYRNRQLKQNLLERLSRLLSDNQPLSFTVEDIKTKFRNLRTIFQREHKAVNSNRTCGSEDFYLPKWKHYKELMFLCDSCDEDEQPEDLRFLGLQGSSPALVEDQVSCNRSYQQRASEESNAKHFHKSPPESDLSSPSLSPSPSTSSFHTDSQASVRMQAGRRATPTGSEVFELLRTFCQNQTVSPHEGFLKYVEECLNQTPPNKVRKLKRRIIETIHSTAEELTEDPAGAV